MTDLSARPVAPASSPIDQPLYGAAADQVRDQLAEPSDLAAAIRVGRRVLDIYGTVDSVDIFAYAQAHGGLAESLRILLRALGAEPVDEQAAVRRSVDAQFPAVAAFLADEAEHIRDGGQL